MMYPGSRGMHNFLSRDPDPPGKIRLLVIHEELLVEPAELEIQVFADEKKSMDIKKLLRDLILVRHNSIATEVKSDASPRLQGVIFIFQDQAAGTPGLFAFRRLVESFQ